MFYINDIFQEGYFGCIIYIYMHIMQLFIFSFTYYLIFITNYFNENQILFELLSFRIFMEVLVSHLSCSVMPGYVCFIKLLDRIKNYTVNRKMWYAAMQ